jgi:hypothetical protein
MDGRSALFQGDLYSRMIIAVDFDNTLAVTDHLNNLRPIPETVEFCKQHLECGDTLILWTCRWGKALEEAINWCKEQGIVFDYINGEHPDTIDVYGKQRKVFADIYLDDSNMLLSDLKK